MSSSFLIIDPGQKLQFSSCPGQLLIQPDKKQGTTIEQIRQLQTFLALTPFSAHQKTVIIPGAQRLTLPAQNALLKTLEEPPPNSTILLTVDHPDNLLPTVVSRCQKISRLEARELKLDSPASIFQPQSSNLQLPTSAADALKLAQELTEKTQTELIDLLNNWALQLRPQLTQTHSQIKKILWTKKALQANVNPKLALENLLLSLI